ncbi:Transposable element Tcb1 transposase, partial [Stegodyphus mimosarum]
MIDRLEWGRTQLEVSGELGIAQSVISRLWQRFRDDGNVGGSVATSGVRKFCLRYQETNSIKNKEGKGRKRCTTSIDDRRIKRLCLQDRKMSSAAIRSDLNDAGVSVSSRTIRRRLTDVGLRGRIPRKKPYLNFQQRKKRLQWAKEHINWTDDQWSQVIWSDETKISLFGSDGRKYVRRRIGEELHPDCIQATVKNPVSVMIWSCMSADGIGRLHVIDGTLNARKYIDTILEPKLLPSIRDLFPNNASFILQQDFAPCHTAKTSKA